MSGSLQLNKLIHSKRNIYLLIVIFSFFIYGNTLSNSYNLDDELVTLNHRLTSKGITAIPEIFTSPYYEDAMGYSYEYRPVVLTSFAIEHEFFGENVAISHLINLLLYIVSLICLYKFLIVLLGQQNILLSLVVTLLFVAFPLHTEVVANIKNRDIILAVLFSLLSAIQLHKFYTTEKPFSLLFSVVLFLLGLLSKSEAVIFLIVVPIAFILFLPVNYKKFTLFLLAFFIASFYYLPIDSILQKVFFLIAIIFVLVMVFFLVNRNISINSIKQFILKLNLSVDQSIEKKSLLPGKIPLFPILFMGAFFLFNACSYYLDIYPKFVFIFSIVIGSIFLFKTPQNEWIIFFYSINILILNFFLPNNNQLDILLWMSSLLIFKINRYAALGLIVFAFTNLLLYKINERSVVYEDYFFIQYLIVVFILTKLKNKTITISLLIISSIISLYADYERLVANLKISKFQFTYDVVFALIPILFISIVWFNKKSIAIKSIAVFFLIAFSTSILFFNNNLSIIDKNAIETKNIITKATLTPINKTDRPINYVELPLSVNAPFSEKIGTSTFILGSYLKKMLLPYPLGFYYGYAYIEPVSINNLQSLVSILFHMLLFFIAVFYLNKQPILSFGVIFYLVSIAAFSNLIQPLAGVIADRFAYIPSLGFCIILGYALIKLFKILPDKKKNYTLPIGFIIITVLILSTYSYLTIARNAQWKNHLTLMRHDIKYLDKSAQAHNLLASNLMKYSFDNEYAGEAVAMRQEAIGHYKRAVEIYPKFFNVWYDLGRAYMLFNDIDNAYPCFKKVNEMDSTFTTATLNLAMISEAKNNLTEAEKFYKEIIRINPSVKESYSNLSYLYFKEGMPNESIKVNEAAINYSPQWKEPYENIIRVYLSQKDTVNAQRYYNMMPK